MRPRKKNRHAPLACAVYLFFLETNLGFRARLGFKNVESVQPKLHSRWKSAFGNFGQVPESSAEGTKMRWNSGNSLLFC
jgi:hypothetical protein